MLEAVSTKQTRGDYEEEYRIIRPDGSIRWIKDRAFPIRDESGQIYRIAGIAEDITQRKQAAEELRLQTTLLESQSEASIDGILVVSGEGRMISLNRRFTEMWGIPPEVVALKSDEAALRVVVERLHDPEAFLAKIAHLYEHREEECRDEVALRDGRVFDRYRGPITGKDGRCYGRIWFQNPTEVQRGRISHIVNAGRHLLNLINEFLDISRIEAGRLELSMEPVNVVEALR